MTGAAFADALEHRRADIALGPTPSADRAASIATVPFLRCRMVIVAAPGHPLAGRRALTPADLQDERWLAGEPELDPTAATGLYFARSGLHPPRLVNYTSTAAALAAAAAGDGIALSPMHAVVDDVRRRSLVRLDVAGTPTVELWHANTLGVGRALPAALAFQRFAATPEATQAISSGRAGTVSAHGRPRVHVTLWRAVADELDAGR
jgi:DNA-binding transcriptional LysR family regulator